MRRTSTELSQPDGHRSSHLSFRGWAFLLIGAALALSACAGSPEFRAVTADGLSETATAGRDARDRAEAVDLAQGVLPRKDLALAYVYQEPGIPLIDENLSLDGGTPVPLRVNQYRVWELEPGTHLLEAWRGNRRLGSRSLRLRPGEVIFFKFAVKNNLGGKLYLVQAGDQEGRIFVRSANFGAQ
ncbi:hypothetical protein [Rhodospirillum sp. A1_3_36]|uniref:hypothetical protein n=1 Tax=Rhodospirillum sp. A1_3_36 TaxID=3391666 RepID=UPI0039A6642A